MFDPKGSCAPCAPETTGCDVAVQTPYAPHGLSGNPLGGLSYGSDCAGNPTQIYNFNTPSGQYFVGDYLNAFKGTNKTIPLFKAYLTQYPTIAQLLFDYDQILDPAKGQSVISALTYKTFPNTELIEAHDGMRFLWSEWKYDEPEVHIIRDEAAPTNVFLVGDQYGNPINISGCNLRTKALFQVNDTLMIKTNDPGVTQDPDCCSMAEVRTITEIGTAVFNGQTYTQITVEGGAGGGQMPLFSVKGRNGFGGNDNKAELNGAQYYQGIYPGDTVIRAFQSRNDCDQITNEFQENPYTMKQSFVQSLGYKWKMNKSELNRNYATEQGAIDYINSKVWGINMGLVSESARTFYLGRNRNPINTAGVGGSSLPRETMGVLPAMWDAHLRKPQLGIIKSARHLLTDEDRVRLILEQILSVQNSGFIPRGSTVTMVMDNAALATFMKLNNAWNKFTGFMVTNTDNVTKNFTIPTIVTPNGKTEVMTCNELTKISGNSGTILFVPKSLVMLKARANSMFNINGGGIVKATQGVQMIDITVPALDGHECRTYNFFTEMAIILGAVDGGSWKMIEGFRI